MACERYGEALADVAAGAPFPAGLETHLGACDACRDELAALRQALALAHADLADRLSAEPSPELAARILRAVAEAGPSLAWRFGWLWPAMAAAATLLVALAVWVAREPSPRARVAVAPGSSAPAPRPFIPGDPVLPGREGSPVSVVPRVVPRPAPERSAGALDRGSPRRPLAARTRASSEVLVPPGEKEALLHFMALVHRERLSPTALVAAGQPSADLAEPAPLDIPPLEIVPLDPAETSGT